jgi:broad specificity phosphatase PhoE
LPDTDPACTELKATRADSPQLSLWPFDTAFVSPLRRARQTAEMVWQGRSGEPAVLPALREVDLYSLQGLTKSEAKATPQYAGWSKTPHLFELDGHAPVRELWFRASLAWRSILESASSVRGDRHILVVAHNAVNQALLGTAVGWGPDAFRRFEQSNAAYTTVTLVPGETPHSPAVATAGRLNITADGWAERAQPGALVLIAAPEGRGAATEAAKWRVLLQRVQSAPPVVVFAHAPGEMAHWLRGELEQGGGQFQAMVLDGDDGVDSVLQQRGAGAPSTADGITLVVAPPAQLERLLHHALLPARGRLNAFCLDSYGVSVLNPTAAGASWPLTACVINNPLDQGVM